LGCHPLEYQGHNPQNEVGIEVVKGICRNVDADLVINSNGKLLGDDQVAILNVESLCEAKAPLV